MNEYSILYHLLTRKMQKSSNSKEFDLGITEENLNEALNMPKKDNFQTLRRTLQEFSRAIQPFGLLLRKNPFNNHWFISQTSEISELFSTNPFNSKPRLAATLTVIIGLCI